MDPLAGSILGISMPIALVIGYFIYCLISERRPDMMVFALILGFGMSPSFFNIFNGNVAENATLTDVAEKHDVKETKYETHSSSSTVETPWQEGALGVLLFFGGLICAIIYIAWPYRDLLIKSIFGRKEDKPDYATRKKTIAKRTTRKRTKRKLQTKRHI